MQTFLPYASFAESAKVLDFKRLGKQRVECKQILITLGCCVGEHQGNLQSRWRNHPAVRMWRGYEPFLVDYAKAICAEWIVRGYKDTLYDQFQKLRIDLRDTTSARPLWLGEALLHATHRSNLLRKLPSHYGQFGWVEHSEMAYEWPVGL